MMINITPNSLLKIFSATKIPLSGNMAIKKIPKNRYFTNARLHSFCFFAVASMASFMFKFCLFRILLLERILAKFAPKGAGLGE